MGPVAGVVGLAAERSQTGEVGHIGRRQTASGHDAEARADVVAGIGLDLPAVALLIEHGAGDPGIQLHVVAQFEAVGHVVDVAQDLRLGGVALGPVPLLLQLLIELIGVFHALDVATRARVAIPEPGAADAAAGLEHPRREPQTPQPEQHVQAGEPGADDDGVVLITTPLDQLTHHIPLCKHLEYTRPRAGGPVKVPAPAWQ